MRRMIPIRDRRQHKRILTLKNFGKALIALLILIAGLSIDYSFRPAAKGEYGRLLGGEMPATPVSPRNQQIVLEAPVAEHTAAVRSEERRVGKECRSRWS